MAIVLGFLCNLTNRLFGPLSSSPDARSFVSHPSVDKVSCPKYHGRWVENSKPSASQTRLKHLLQIKPDQAVTRKFWPDQSAIAGHVLRFQFGQSAIPSVADLLITIR